MTVVMTITYDEPSVPGMTWRVSRTVPEPYQANDAANSPIAGDERFTRLQGTSSRSYVGKTFWWRL